MKHRWMGVAGAVAAAILVSASSGRAQEKGNEFPWNVSVTAGRLDMEGDQAVRDGFVGSIRLGRDWTDWWTFETVLSVVPELKGGRYIHYNEETASFEEINRLVQRTGKNSAWALGIAEDALFHFTRWKRLDPYLALGVGATKYSEDLNDNNGWDASMRGGGGVQYHFNDEWAVRGDFRGFFGGLLGDKGSANSVADVGACWTWGARVPPLYRVGSGVRDSDAEGLTDAEEDQIGTDKFRPDTDGDGLTDFEEVRTYGTDPKNPDTDWDGLTDGAEVNTWKTDPKARDTDKGGVADGHEVIEDHTDPLNPADDLILKELYLQFEYNKSDIKPEYYSQLDVIGKMLARDPGSTARIEGHADKLKKSRADYNIRLSKDRAQAVVDYIARTFDIDRIRMEAVGYGFSRPKAENHPVNGNPVNRRVEVYIRPSARAADAGASAVVPAGK